MKNKNRTLRIPVPVSLNEKYEITQRAHRADMSAAEYVRFLALGGKFLPAPDGAKLVPVIEQVTK